jgi:MFS family permease
VIAVLTVSPYIGPIEKEFGWSRVQVSLAFTIVAYMIVLVSPLQGFLADRYGPRRVVLTSIPLFAASLAALYFTPKNLLVYYSLWLLCHSRNRALAAGVFAGCESLVRSQAGAWRSASRMPESVSAVRSCR